MSDEFGRLRCRDVRRYECGNHVHVHHEEDEGVLHQDEVRVAQKVLSFGLSEGLAPELAQVLLT